MTRLLLTRPRAQAGEWLRRLADLGVDAAGLPLIAILPAASAEPAAAAWRALQAGSVALAVFVSPNAVEQFFAGTKGAWPADCLAACVGPGSARALEAAGVPAAQIVQPAPDAASLDSEHLWLQLQARDWAGRRAIFLRGDGGREWLAERLQAAGASTEAFAVYRRAAPQWTDAERAVLAQALAAPERHAWLFSSAEAVGQLAALVPAADWAAQRAIATHARIAEAARALGFGPVVLTRPDAPSVVEALRGLEGV